MTRQQRRATGEIETYGVALFDEDDLATSLPRLGQAVRTDPGAHGHRSDHEAPRPPADLSR